MRIQSRNRQAIYISAVGTAVRVNISLPRAIPEFESESVVCERINSVYSAIEESYLRGAKKYADTLTEKDRGHSAAVNVKWERGVEKGRVGNSRITFFRRCVISSFSLGERAQSDRDVFAISNGLLIK